ncbi:Uncharacterised protein [Vibrio cholerae]|nr:Uncharacterised protein [Vibrio cholerae]
MASAGTKIGLLAEICFIPLCQNSKPFTPRRVMAFFSSSPLAELWKRSTASTSSKRKGRSKIRYFLVNFSNLDSEGAASCTSPLSKASNTLSSSYSVELGNTCIQALPFISSLTRFSSSDAAIPFGCLSVLVTWLNLITISPGSQLAAALKLVTARIEAAIRVSGLNILILLGWIFQPIIGLRTHTKATCAPFITQN